MLRLTIKLLDPAERATIKRISMRIREPAVPTSSILPIMEWSILPENKLDIMATIGIRVKLKISLDFENSNSPDFMILNNKMRRQRVAIREMTESLETKERAAIAGYDTSGVRKIKRRKRALNSAGKTLGLVNGAGAAIVLDSL